MVKLCLDVIGHILKFNRYIPIFMKCLTLSKHVKDYLYEYGHIICKHLNFNTILEKEIPRYATTITVHTPLNDKNIHFIRQDNIITSLSIYKCNTKNISILRNLTKLTILSSPTLCDDHLKQLPNLKYLECSSTKITDKGLSYVTSLEHLLLKYNNNITDNGLKYLKKIKVLSLLGNTKISDKGLSYMPKNVVEITLYDNNMITDIGLKHFEDIRVLSLVSNKKITNDGLKHLKKLEELYINSNTNITDDGIIHMKNLTTLVIGGNISYACLESLKNIEEAHIGGASFFNLL